MSRICQALLKKPLVGNSRSHAMNATKKRFLPNLHWHRFWVPSQGRFIRLRVSCKAMRSIDKLGIEAFIKTA